MSSSGVQNMRPVCFNNLRPGTSPVRQVRSLMQMPVGSPNSTRILGFTLRLMKFSNGFCLPKSWQHRAGGKRALGNMALPKLGFLSKPCVHCRAGKGIPKQTAASQKAGYLSPGPMTLLGGCWLVKANLGMKWVKNSSVR